MNFNTTVSRKLASQVNPMISSDGKSETLNQLSKLMEDVSYLIYLNQENKGGSMADSMPVPSLHLIAACVGSALEYEAQARD